jgi:hypothetical protein
LIYLLYQDDGPDGICGQSMDITSKWTRLIEVAHADDVRRLWRLPPGELSEALSFCGISGSAGRKNARIVAAFSDIEEDRWLTGANEIVKATNVP